MNITTTNRLLHSEQGETLTGLNRCVPCLQNSSCD